MGAASAGRPGTVAERRAALARALRAGGRIGSRPVRGRRRVGDSGAAARPGPPGGPAGASPAASVGASLDAPAGAPRESVAALDERLRRLSRAADLTRAELVEALVRFDELEGWRAAGARSCVAWQVTELGASRSLAYVNLQVGRALRELPVIRSLFRTGELSFSKVRALVGTATPEDERALSIMALDNDADAVHRLCDDYRWGREAAAGDEGARERARFERRSLVHSRLPDGSTLSRLVLPPELAALVAGAVEALVERRAGEDGAGDGTGDGTGDGAGGDGSPSGSSFESASGASSGSSTRPSLEQRRADALVELCRTASCAPVADGAGASAMDLVVAVVGAGALERAEAEVAARGPDDGAPLPLPLRAGIAGVLGGGIGPSTARRLACAGSLVTMILKGGEPVAMGRKIRLHNAAQRRALHARDGGCTFPGCGRRTNLQPHHVGGWAWGATTSVRDAASLCPACHAKVHDEGWVVTRVPDDAPADRHPAAAALLDGADGRTRALTGMLDARRPRFRFDLPGGAGRSDPGSGPRTGSNPGPGLGSRGARASTAWTLAGSGPSRADPRRVRGELGRAQARSGPRTRPAASTTRHGASKRCSSRLFPVPPIRSTTANDAGADSGVSTPCHVPRR